MISKGVLYFNNELDVLLYYSKVAPILFNFLKGKKIATKVHVPGFFFLKRGSKEKPLFISDFSVVDKKMLELRKGHLKDVKDKLNFKQQLVWDYFPPRKLIQFFYATNDEGKGKDIERIFIDIDTSKMFPTFLGSPKLKNKKVLEIRKHTIDEARIVALNLIEIIEKDNEFNKLIGKYRLVILWTGSSFHVYLLLDKKININFYNKYLSYGSGKNKEKSFIMKWAKLVEKEVGIKCRAGHEKSDKFIILDSSNTPSGKLARVPFSLHIKGDKEVDGICVPVSIDELKNKNIINKLQKLTPDNVVKKLRKYRENLV